MMNEADDPITGVDSCMDNASPRAALTRFYRAFNSRDLGLTTANWLVTSEVSMANPLGGLRRGWSEISAVYRKIFDGPATVSVEFHDYTIQVAGRLFLAVGRERGTLRMHGECIDLAIRTTRVYTWHDNEWKQLHHHGSMDDPDLLVRYQRLIGTT